MSNINIRPLTQCKKDYLAYTHLVSLLASQYRPYSYEIYTEMIKELDTRSLIYLLEIDNEIVGTIKIIIEKKFYNEKCYVGHIEDVIVDTTYRGQGYGKLLVDFADKICRENHCYKVLLYCSDHNVKFYEKCGYVIDGSNLCKRLNH